jgi:hypothetical protein
MTLPGPTSRFVELQNASARCRPNAPKSSADQGAVIRSRAALGGQTLPVPIRHYFARPNWDTPPYRGPLTSTLLDVPSQKSRPISAVAEPSSVPDQ